MAHYLGIDLGTSAIKAVVVDDAQVVRAQATQPIETTRLNDGRVVQDPDSWWSAVGHIGGWLKHAHAAAMADVRGIGLSEQMQDAVLIGDSGALLRPAIIWSGARSNRQCAELVRDFPELVGITGVLPMPRFTAPKLMWICEHAPDVDVRIVTVLLPNDYLRFKMTGECVSDMSDAAGSGWLDEAKRKWSPLALETTRTQLEWMPNLVAGNALAGVSAGQSRRALGACETCAACGRWRRCRGSSHWPWRNHWRGGAGLARNRRSSVRFHASLLSGSGRNVDPCFVPRHAQAVVSNGGNAE